MKRQTALLALAIALSAASPVNMPGSMPDNGSVTLAEVRANSERIFQFFSDGGSGAVSRQAFVSTRLPPELVSSTPDRKLLDKLFGQLDANRDGRLTREEWDRRIARDLAFADQNSDGRVSLKEIANARKNMNFTDALGMLF